MILNANHWIYDISISPFNLREMMLNEQNIIKYNKIKTYKRADHTYIHTHTQTNKQLDLQTHTMTMAIRINGENESEQNIKKDEIFFCFYFFFILVVWGKFNNWFIS